MEPRAASPRWPAAGALHRAQRPPGTTRLWQHRASPGALTGWKAAGLGCQQRCVFATESSLPVPRGVVGGALWKLLQEPGCASKPSVGAPGKAVPAALAGRGCATSQLSSSLFLPGVRHDYHQRHCAHVRAVGSLLSLQRKYKERQVVKRQPHQVLALKSLLTPVIYLLLLAAWIG